MAKLKFNAKIPAQSKEQRQSDGEDKQNELVILENMVANYRIRIYASLKTPQGRRRRGGSVFQL